MDIRIVETMPTSGGLADPTFRIDPNLETVSLDWNQTDETLAVVDYNLNYNILPWQLYDDCVKKIFLTYNGQSCQTNQLIETVVMESSNEADINQIPGYHNSNEWHYKPREFHYPEELKLLTNPLDYATLPYDYREGFTVVKQFLTAQANVSPGTPAYTAFYRAPTLTSFIPANVEGNRLFIDGWYTSYVCTVKKWTTATPPSNSTGDIVWYDDQFYINLTGNPGLLVTELLTGITKPDTTNWREAPTFVEWQALMMANIGPVEVDDPIYFIESQHLATPELNAAILKELQKNCQCCDSQDYGMSHIDSYMKLMQKRLGAWVNFNQEIFSEAACIVASARKLCHLCLYHDECLTTPRKTC